ncbi:SixA phosphatase family protein [Leptobacterium sp. I13]|uniref:SixA phosphatase family protein n=1 Tax=Leptobacterium meishanense TaxID=3128904 RepID=UPI0030EE219E
MKRLIIVRHAKSSWEYEVNDKDRPLMERGINDAHIVASAIKEYTQGVDVVFSSPANRALHTCMIFLRNLDIPFAKLQIVKNLYDFSGNKVMSLLKSIPETYRTVLIFGHNDALTFIANELGHQYIDNVKTSGVVVVDFKEQEWVNITKGKTIKTIFPKSLR